MLKGITFFIGFVLVLAGVNPVEPSPIWISFPPIFSGLGMMWWSVLPRKGNCYKR